MFFVGLYLLIQLQTKTQTFVWALLATTQLFASRKFCLLFRASGFSHSESSAKPHLAAQAGTAPVGVPLAAGFSILKKDDGKFVVAEVTAARQRVAVGDVLISFGDHIFSPIDSLDRLAKMFHDELINGDENYWPTNPGKQLVVSRQTGGSSQTQFKIRILPAHHSPQNGYLQQQLRNFHASRLDSSSPSSSVRALSPLHHQTDETGSSDLYDGNTQDISLGADHFDSDDTQDMNSLSFQSRRPILKREERANVVSALTMAAAPLHDVTSPASIVAPQEHEDYHPLNHVTVAAAARSHAANFRAQRVHEAFTAAFRKKPASKLEAPLSSLSLSSMLFARPLLVESETGADKALDLKNVNFAKRTGNRKKLRDRQVDFGAAFRKKPVAENRSVAQNDLFLKKLLSKVPLESLLFE